jgi:hypothetical protein
MQREITEGDIVELVEDFDDFEEGTQAVVQEPDRMTSDDEYLVLVGTQRWYWPKASVVRAGTQEPAREDV